MQKEGLYAKEEWLGSEAPDHCAWLRGGPRVEGEGRARDGSGQNRGVGASCPDPAGPLFSSTLGGTVGVVVGSL